MLLQSLYGIATLTQREDQLTCSGSSLQQIPGRFSRAATGLLWLPLYPCSQRICWAVGNKQRYNAIWAADCRDHFCHPSLITKMSSADNQLPASEAEMAMANRLDLLFTCQKMACLMWAVTLPSIIFSVVKISGTLTRRIFLQPEHRIHKIGLRWSCR